jgi:hypothetical protein
MVPRRKQKTPQRLHGCLPQGNAFVTSIIAGFLIEAWSIAELPKQRCHLFHLFYQEQIRLGSPRSSAGCFCSQITAIAPPRPLTRRPASALSRGS